MPRATSRGTGRIRQLEVGRISWSSWETARNRSHFSLLPRRDLSKMILAMTDFTPMLAQGVQSLSSRPMGTDTKLVAGDMGLVIGTASVLGVVLVLLIWWRYSRRSGRKSRHHHRPAIVQNSLKSHPDSRARDEGSDEDDEDGEGDGTKGDSGGQRVRKRRRRRGHRPRNPTLAETGGLPPVRPPESRPPAL